MTEEQLVRKKLIDSSPDSLSGGVIPKSPVPQDVNTALLVSCLDNKMKMSTLPASAADLEPLASLFRRSSGLKSLEVYETGLLTDLPRKNSGSIAQKVVTTSLKQSQHLLTGAARDPLAKEQRVCMVVKHRQANVALCWTHGLRNEIHY